MSRQIIDAFSSRVMHVAFSGSRLVDEARALLRLLESTRKRLERAERRLEHYRRKTAAVAEETRRHQMLSLVEPGYNLNFAAYSRRNGKLDNARQHVFREACVRRSLHAQGKGVP